jgi:hypothetical protein
MRIDRLPILTPQVGARAERHETAEVGDAADAAKIVIEAEARRLSLVEQAQKDGLLAARGGLPIEPGQMTTTGGAQQRLR